MLQIVLHNKQIKVLNSTLSLEISINRRRADISRIEYILKRNRMSDEIKEFGNYICV